MLLEGLLPKLNMILPAVIVVVGIFLFVCRRVTQWPPFLGFEENSSGTWAFIFWWSWWLTILFAYSFFSRSPTKTEMTLLLLNLDIGDLMGISFVVAYLSGDKFSKGRLLIAPAVFWGILLIQFVVQSFVTVPEKASTMLLVSESSVLATVAILAAGWAFVVRWGRVAVPFLFVSVLYSVLQVPAYVHAFFFQVVTIPHLNSALRNCSPDSSNTANFQNLAATLDFQGVFFYLFLGKFVLALTPLVFFMNTKPFNPDLTREKWGPSDYLDKSCPEPQISGVWKHVLRWAAITTVGALIAAAVRKYM